MTNKTGYLNSLKPLVMMQLKDKMDFSYLKSVKRTIFKVIYSIAFFVVLTVVLNLIFSLIMKFYILSYNKDVLNFKAFALLLSIVILLSFISCLANVTKTLYFAKDNPVLLTLPVRSSRIFTSKLIVVFIYEIIRSMNYILPFLVAYGISMKLGIWFFLWATVMTVFLTAFIVLVCGLLSIPAMIVTTWLKRFKIIEIIILTTVVVVGVIAIIKGIRAIPNDINLVRDWDKIRWKILTFLESFSITFKPVVLVVSLLTGTATGVNEFTPFRMQSLIVFLSMLGIILVSIGLTYLLTRPLFFKMASSPFEFRKKLKFSKRRNKKAPAFMSVSWTEFKKSFRDANILYSLLAVVIITPIAIMFENQIIAAMDTRIFGNYLCLIFNILIILLFILTSNVSTASLYSREGNAGYLNKVNPIRYTKILFGKLMFHIMLTCASIIASVVVINLYMHIGIKNSIMIGLALLFVNLAHILWSAELDVMNPQNSQYQTTGEHSKNPNEAKSTIIAFLTSFIFMLITFFLITENYEVMFGKMLFISTVFVAFRIYFYFTRVKLYYKEK